VVQKQQEIGALEDFLSKLAEIGDLLGYSPPQLNILCCINANKEWRLFNE
jgi:hypothetical protein